MSEDKKKIYEIMSIAANVSHEADKRKQRLSTIERFIVGSMSVGFEYINDVIDPRKWERLLIAQRQFNDALDAIKDDATKIVMDQRAKLSPTVIEYEIPEITKQLINKLQKMGAIFDDEFMSSFCYRDAIAVIKSYAYVDYQGIIMYPRDEQTIIDLLNDVGIPFGKRNVGLEGQGSSSASVSLGYLESAKKRLSTCSTKTIR